MPKILFCGKGGSGEEHTAFPSRKAMADEGGKRLCVVLNKTDGDTESLMRTHLEGQGIRIAATLPQSREVAACNLRALPLEAYPFREHLLALTKAIES